MKQNTFTDTSGARELARYALEIGAVRISPEQPFTWASGYRMPIYNDNRLLMRYARGRALVRAGFLELLGELEVEGPTGQSTRPDRIAPFDGIAGTASAGIAPATLLAEALERDLYYVRSGAKKHGLQRVIEGVGSGVSAEDKDRPMTGRSILLVEDLISTGGSSLAAAEALEAAGARVPLCLAIFSYGFETAHRAFSGRAPGIPLRTILDLETLLQVAETDRRISPREVQLVKSWRTDPFGWAASHREGAAHHPAADTPAGGSSTEGFTAADTRATGSSKEGPTAVRPPDGPTGRTTWQDRLRRSAQAARSLLCVGIDPLPEVMTWAGAGHGVGDGAGREVGRDAVTRSIIDHVVDLLDEIESSGVPPAAFKPNIGYFHALDRPRERDFSGSQALASILDLFRDRFSGVPVILDAKRGDIARSSANYATEAFAAWGVDAVTVSPWMGDDSVKPLLSRAADPDLPGSDRGVYVLVRTSNPGATRFQDRPEGDPAYRRVLQAVREWGRDFSGAGMVVGATAPAELREILSTLAGTDPPGAGPLPLLIPGVGGQGGSTREVMDLIRVTGYPPELIRINASRSILYPWVPGAAPPDRDARRAALGTAYRELHRACSWDGVDARGRNPREQRSGRGSR